MDLGKETSRRNSPSPRRGDGAHRRLDRSHGRHPSPLGKGKEGTVPTDVTELGPRSRAEKSDEGEGRAVTTELRPMASRQPAGLASPWRASALTSLSWAGLDSEITKRQQETQQEELNAETAACKEEELVDGSYLRLQLRLQGWGG